MLRRRRINKSALTLLVGGMAALVLMLALIAQDRGKDNQRKTRSARTTAPVDVLNLPVRELDSQEIARLNLSCAAGLAGAEQVDLDRCLGELEQMAAKVHSETERHFYRFRRAPAEFENSEGFFRMLMLTVVLAEDSNTPHNLDCLPVALPAGSLERSAIRRADARRSRRLLAVA